MKIVQFIGAAATGQVIVALGCGSTAPSAAAQRCVSYAARTAGVHGVVVDVQFGFDWASVEFEIVPSITVKEAGALVAQYARFVCIIEARLAASMAASERMRALLVLESAIACIEAMPRRPIESTMSATITSTSVKPAVRRRATDFRCLIGSSHPCDWSESSSFR